MDKKQIAHGLAVAHMVGKDLPTEELVAEYQKKYDFITLIEAQNIGAYLQLLSGKRACELIR